MNGLNKSMPWVIVLAVLGVLITVYTLKQTPPAVSCYSATAIFQTVEMPQPEVVLFNVCLQEKGEQDGGTNSTVQVPSANRGTDRGGYQNPIYR